jgi:hypothetical protein
MGEELRYLITNNASPNIIALWVRIMIMREMENPIIRFSQSLGMSEKEFRTAKIKLQQLGWVTFQATNYGSIIKFNIGKSDERAGERAGNDIVDIRKTIDSFTYNNDIIKYMVNPVLRQTEGQEERQTNSEIISDTADARAADQHSLIESNSNNSMSEKKPEDRKADRQTSPSILYSNIDNNKLSSSNIRPTLEILVEPYRVEFGDKIIDDFLRYWTEPNKSGKKLRWEMEKTWSTKGRLVTWRRNDDRWNKKPVGTQNNNISKFDAKRNEIQNRGKEDI